MKTLSETIKDMEQCKYLDSDCSQCPAIYYLKEYREKEVEYDNAYETMERVRKQYREAKQQYITAHANLYAEEPNDPLTWDELELMVGKPVWVETKYYSSRWAVITDVDDVRIRFVGRQLLDSEIVQEMGDTWQAYRKERKATGGNLTPEPKSKKIGDDTEIKWSEK